MYTVMAFLADRDVMRLQQAGKRLYAVIVPGFRATWPVDKANRRRVTRILLGGCAAEVEKTGGDIAWVAALRTWLRMVCLPVLPKMVSFYVLPRTTSLLFESVSEAFGVV